MASGIAPPASRPPELPPRGKIDPRDALIDDRLRQTRRRVKGVDIAAGLIGLAVGTLGYLLVAAVLDHWVVPGGLGFWGRLVLFLGLVAAAGWYSARHLLPLLIFRINPLFAAQVIEQSRPSLKNGLINFLFLRRQRSEIVRDKLSRVIYGGLQQKAAAELGTISVDTAVDRSQVIRRGYVLIGVLAVGCLYLLLSPKNPLVSFRRVVWPWAAVRAPTRVTITRVSVNDLEPGDRRVFQGETVSVSAEVDGLAAGEPVLLYYTTADGQSVDQAVPMERPEGEYRHRCELPPGSFGLQQDLEYYLTAGDCRTRRYKLLVETALTILVDRVEYQYPEYTGIPTRTTLQQGDVSGVEGTRVTIGATASHPIDQAVIEMDCDPRSVVKMRADGQSATGRFTLRMSPDDPTRPEHDSYQIRFTDSGGNQSRRPIRHRIEVIPDLQPEIRWIDRPRDQVQLPANGVLKLQLRAEDPDFGLRRVTLRAERDGRSLAIRPLFDRPRPEKAHEGPMSLAYRFEPARFEPALKPGDKVIYWAEAQDNKEPVPNRTTNDERRWIQIVAADGPQAPEERPEESGEPGEAEQERPGQPKEQPPERGPDDPGRDQEGDPQPDDPPQEAPPDQQPGPGEQPQEAEPEEQEQQDQPDQQPADPEQSGEPGGSPESGGPEGQSGAQDSGQGSGEPSGEQAGDRSEPIDGETNPGDAFEEILEHRAEQEQKEGESGQAEESPEPPQGEEPGQGGQGGQPTGDQNPAGDQGQSGGPQASQNRDRQTPPQGGNQASGGQPDEPQPTPDNDPSGSGQPDSARKPEPGQGAQSKGPGEPNREEPSSGGGQENPDARGGDPQQSKGPGGAGKPSGQNTGSPSPQADSQQRGKQPGEGDQSPSGEGQEAQSPTTSPKDSDSQGDTSGDRSGGGEEGGGQKSQQPGTGSSGTNTASEQGGSQSDQQGEGETGTGAGDQVKADRPTGNPASEGEGPGSGSRQQPGGQGGAEKPALEPSDSSGGKPAETDRPGGRSGGQDPKRPNGFGQAKPNRGGKPDRKPTDPPPPPEPTAPDPDDPNLEYTRKATDLALEHLKDQLAKESPDQDLLDRLGWTPDDLKKFYRWWEQKKRAAGEPGAVGKGASNELEEALRSLGLRPRGTELKGGGLKADRGGKLTDSRRLEPPSEWADQVRAYTKAIAGGDE